MPTNQKIEGKEEDCVSTASQGKSGFHFKVPGLVLTQDPLEPTLQQVRDEHQDQLQKQEREEHEDQLHQHKQEH